MNMTNHQFNVYILTPFCELMSNNISDIFKPFIPHSSYLGPYSVLMQVVCCVCQRHIKFKDGQGTYGVSHGICDECMKKMRRKR